VTAFLGRARYERTAAAIGSRNGSRLKPIPEPPRARSRWPCHSAPVRSNASSARVIPGCVGIVRTRPLEALVIGAYRAWPVRSRYRSLRMKPAWPRLQDHGQPALARVRARYAAFCAKSRLEPNCWRCIWMRCICPTRPSGRKEGVGWWPGATDSVANGCCLPVSSDSASCVRTGWNLGARPHPTRPTVPVARVK